MTTATPWRMLLNELADYISGGNPDGLVGLQMVTGNHLLMWDHPEWGEATALTEAQAIPVWRAEWSPTAATVEKAYGKFLDCCIAPDAHDAAAAEEAAALSLQLADVEDRIEVSTEAAETAWEEFDRRQQSRPAAEQIGKDAWLARKWGPRIARLEVERDDVRGQWGIAVAKAGGGWQNLGEAREALDNPAFLTNAKGRDGQVRRYRSWDFQPPLSDWVAEARAGHGTGMSLTITKNTSTVSTTSTRWGADVGVSLGIVSVEAGGGREHVEVDVDREDFSMTFAAGSFGAIRATPGGWFDQNLVTQWKNGPFNPKSPKGVGQIEFFGAAPRPDGVPVTFNLLQSVYYVAYRPSVTATLDQKSFDFVRESWDAGGKIGIGPFHFGGGVENVEAEAHFNQTTRSLTLTGLSDHPQLVAVDCTVLPDDHWV